MKNSFRTSNRSARYGGMSKVFRAFHQFQKGAIYDDNAKH